MKYSSSNVLPMLSYNFCKSHCLVDTDVHTKREDDNETFYGTAIAEHDVSAYEMGEDEVSYQLLSSRLGLLNSNVDPGAQCLSIIKDERDLQLSDDHGALMEILRSADGRNSCIELGFIRYHLYVSQSTLQY